MPVVATLPPRRTTPLVFVVSDVAATLEPKVICPLLARRMAPSLVLPTAPVSVILPVPTVAVKSKPPLSVPVMPILLLVVVRDTALASETFPL